MKNYVVQLLGWSENNTQSLTGELRRWAVFLIGPPGSGKGTQADLLAEKFGLVHVQTSKLGEAKINDSELVNRDPEIAEVKKLYDKGELFPPPWTVKIVLEKAQELADQDKGVVFSGSPRTIYEIENELSYFENLYGRENMKFINLKIDEDESINRNVHRRVCKANGHSIPNFEQFNNVQVCPHDGSEIITRSLDNPDTIKTRNEVYQRRTEPILKFLEKRGYKFLKVNGEQTIENVFKEILSNLNDKS